jgi:hypothetical protein
MERALELHSVRGIPAPIQCQRLALFGLLRQFIEMAETWNQLAAETECHKPLIQAIFESGFDEP